MFNIGFHPKLGLLWRHNGECACIILLVIIQVLQGYKIGNHNNYIFIKMSMLHKQVTQNQYSCDRHMHT